MTFLVETVNFVVATAHLGYSCDSHCYEPECTGIDWP